MNLNIREWFKNDQAKQEAPELERKARENLDNQPANYLESLDTDTQEVLLDRYEKTSDATFADDIALEKLTGKPAGEWLNPESPGALLFEEIVTKLGHTLEREFDHLEQKREELEILRIELSSLNQEIEIRKHQIDNIVPVSFARQDEFYSDQFSESEQELANLQKEYHRLANKLEVEESDYKMTKSKYQQDLARFYGLRASLDPDQQREMEQNN